MFGDVVIYRNNLRIPVSLVATNQASSIQLQVQYHGCTDRGICYPPQKKIFDITLPAATPVAKANPLELLVKSLPELKFKTTEDELLPPDQAFQFFATVKDASTLHVNWEIAEGYYLYREQIRLELINAADVKIGNYTIPRGTPKHDEAFGQVEIFHNELGFDLPIIRANSSAQTITLQAKYQGCADRGVCYPPMTKKIDLELPAAQNITPIADTHPTSRSLRTGSDCAILAARQPGDDIAQLFWFRAIVIHDSVYFSDDSDFIGHYRRSWQSHYHRQSIFPVPQLCRGFSFHLHGVWHTRRAIRQ